MKFGQKLGYIGFGALLMLISMMASSVLMPSLVAQRDKFGEIECTGLSVVNANGKIRILLGAGEGGGGLRVMGDGGKSVVIETGGVGPNVRLQSFPKGNTVVLSTGERSIAIVNKLAEVAAEVGVDEYNEGYVRVNNTIGKVRALMAVDQDGKGVISTYDKNGYRQ